MLPRATTIKKFDKVHFIDFDEEYIVEEIVYEFDHIKHWVLIINNFF